MNLQNYVDIAIDSFARALESRRIYLPLDFADSLFGCGYSISPSIVHLTDRIKEVDLDGTFCANMTLRVIENIHRQWIRDNITAFHRYPDMRYKFMPMPLIGIDAVLRYYDLLWSFLSLLGIAPTETELRKQYNSTQDAFMTSAACVFLDEFVKKLLADYGVSAAQEEIVVVVNQVAAHSPALISRKGFDD